MTEPLLSAWLAELVEALAAMSSLAGEADDPQLDRLLERGLSLDLAAGDEITGDLLVAAINALGGVHAALGHEIAAVHRERLDVDRTVKAITAYVKALD